MLVCTGANSCVHTRVNVCEAVKFLCNMRVQETCRLAYPVEEIRTPGDLVELFTYCRI